MSSPRARQLSTEGPSAGGHEFDDIFDYDAGIDDPFSENYVVPGAKEKELAAKAKEKDSAGKSSSGAGLGIDEEIDTRKPRAPRVKLDEHRLLSDAGIPKLRKRAAKQLKFKGKGHEYSDCAQLLKLYQLWLDDLFPKARFLDALAMVEKMGHKRQLQSARMEWINEGQPKSVHEDSLFDEPALPRMENDVSQAPLKLAPLFQTAATERPTTPEREDSRIDVDNLYDATPLPARPKPPVTTSLFGGGNTSLFGAGKTVEEDDVPDDDLDALMAEADVEVNAFSRHPQSVAKGVDEQDGDDLDAWMAEAEAEASSEPKQPTAAPNRVETQHDDYEDDMEAMAEMEGW